MWRATVAGVLLVACREPPAPVVQRPAPVRLALGDCARPSRSFEVGPRPLPLAAITGDADGPDLPRKALDYRPGAASPLRAVATELADCFADAPKPYGVLLVDLVRSTAGTTLATVHGETDRIRWCVEGVARKLVVEQPSQRCSLAFGTMPLDEVPAIDLTKDDVLWNGQRVAGVESVVRDDAPQFRIEALEDEVRRFFALASSRQLAVRGPIMLRAVPETPMIAINRALNSTAGVEVVLATGTGDDWRLVDDLALPVVPVPAGSGGNWNLVPWDATTEPTGDQPSLLVERQALWVGAANRDGAERIPRLASSPDWAALERVLRRQRAARFRGRTDLEIVTNSSQDQPVDHGDLIRAIETAKAAGFTAWRRDWNGPKVRPE